MSKPVFVYTIYIASTPETPHVEISLINCISESQNILHTRGSVPCRELCFLHFANV